MLKTVEAKSQIIEHKYNDINHHLLGFLQQLDPLEPKYNNQAAMTYLSQER